MLNQKQVESVSHNTGRQAVACVDASADCCCCATNNLMQQTALSVSDRPALVKVMLLGLASHWAGALNFEVAMYLVSHVKCAQCASLSLDKNEIYNSLMFS